MKKLMVLIVMAIISVSAYSQALESVKVVIVNDSLIQMGTTNGRMQLLIAAPAAGKSIIVQSIDVRNAVNNRLYSATTSDVNYLIGYAGTGHWNTVASIPFDKINSKGNTTFYYGISTTSTLWESTVTDAMPLMIRFDQPSNFSSGYNKLTLYITYRVLN